MNIKKELQVSAQKVESFLQAATENQDMDLAELYRSMQYSLLNGGKRIRPFLTLEFSKIFGGTEENAMHFAAAVEMIHTYSLIHDDLPCMDDASFRRGRFSNHKIFGEATAVLCGDALLTEAFSMLTRANVSDTSIVNAVRILAQSAGALGMVGGQIMDMKAEDVVPNFATLKKLYSKKTGAMIVAAAKLGCLSANVNDEAVIRSAEEYAVNLGVAFQIVDDILDAYGDVSVLGKPTGADVKNGKTTFLSFMGKDEAFECAKSATDKAIRSISHLHNTKSLQALALFLLKRVS